MRLAHDLFSETNPAYCAYVLGAFVKSYFSIRPPGPDVPLAYLALPVALSGDLNDAFRGTNKATGLLEWIERNPKVRVGLAERVNLSLPMVSEGIRFGCFSGTLAMDDKARLTLGKLRFKQSALKALSEDSAAAIKHSERLGYWFAMAGETRAVFAITEFAP